MTAEHLASPTLAAAHGFFTRRGGVSEGPYASLNCSLSSADDPTRVAANRARVAASLGAAPEALLGLTQVHSAEVVTATAAWPAGQGARADAMVTRVSGLVLGIITADCAPVLFHDADAGVVGAAHAGWRGAAAGALEVTIAAMEALGAEAGRIHAVVGPCIALASYEVGDDMRDAVLALDPGASAMFHPGKRAAHHQFDLAGFCLHRLRRAGVADAAAIGSDTCADDENFFSHRRRTLAGGGPIGHQMSAICV